VFFVPFFLCWYFVLLSFFSGGSGWPRLGFGVADVFIPAATFDYFLGLSLLLFSFLPFFPFLWLPIFFPGESRLYERMLLSVLLDSQNSFFTPFRLVGGSLDSGDEFAWFFFCRGLLFSFYLFFAFLNTSFFVESPFLFSSFLSDVTSLPTLLLEPMVFCFSFLSSFPLPFLLTGLPRFESQIIFESPFSLRDATCLVTSISQPHSPLLRYYQSSFCVFFFFPFLLPHCQSLFKGPFF